MAGKTANGGTIRVASYNIRKCIGLDRRRRPERTLGVIAGLNADIVAVQEADRRLGRRPSTIPHAIVGDRTGLVPVDLSHNAVSLGWHGNAILAREGIGLNGCERLELPGLEPRGAVIAELHFRGLWLRVVGIHLGLIRKHRLRQLCTIAAALGSRQRMPTVILGDFNEWSTERGLEPLNREFEVHVPGPSYHAARPVAALDRIAVSRDLRIHDAGVYTRGGALRASDHLPVWADVTLPGDA